VRFFKRSIGEKVVGLYRIADDNSTAEFLGTDSDWHEDPDLLRYTLLGDVGADEITEDEARLLAAHHGGAGIPEG
jgi:hypothetical protein